MSDLVLFWRRRRGEDGCGDGAFAARGDRLGGKECGNAGDVFDGCLAILMVGLGGDGATGYGRVDDFRGDDVLGGIDDDGGLGLLVLFGFGAHRCGDR